MCTCLALNIPFFQMSKPDKQICNDLEKFKQTLVFNVCENNDFIDITLLGILIKSFSVFCREFLTLCVEIALSILLIVYFRRFLASRQTIVPIPAIHRTTSAERNIYLNARNHELAKATYIITQFSISSVILNTLNFGLLVFFTGINSTVTSNLLGVFAVLTIISKPFLTIILLFKIEKNFIHFIRDKLIYFF